MTAKEAVEDILPADNREPARLNSGRDVILNLIVKAINTGCGNARPRGDRYFYIGRVSAFVYSAASAAHLLYGADFKGAQRLLSRLVGEVREEWPEDHLRDAGRVGNEADGIVTQLLDTVW